VLEEVATAASCCAAVDRRPIDASLVVCLAGNPNVGKSSVFNRLTGAAVETANYAGMTVGALGRTTDWSGREVAVVDLPGIYAAGMGGEEQQHGWVGLLVYRPDVVVAVVDATNLARNLYLVFQLLDLGLPVVVSLNLVDQARRRHLTIDTGLLARELGVAVVPTVASTGEGVDELKRAIVEAARAGAKPAPQRYSRAAESQLEELSVRLEARAQRLELPFGLTPRAAAFSLLEGVEEIACALEPVIDDHQVAGDGADAARPRAASVGPPAQPARGPSVARRGARGHAVARPTGAAPRWPLRIAAERHGAARALARAACSSNAPARQDRLWRICTSPVTGLPILAVVLVSVLAFLFIVGEWLAGALTSLWMATAQPVIHGVVHTLLGNGDLAAIVLWGIDGGILAALAVGIPYILTFYFLLALLEDSGYMSAAAFLSDRVMHRFGLHGQAVIPLVAAAGCSVPAVLGTRVLPTMRERVIACTLISLAPCSARTAVIIGAVAMYAGWQWALFVYAVIALVGISAGLLLGRMLPGESSALIMEVFPIRRPSLRLVARKTWSRFREFVWVAAPIIVGGSMALGALYETGLIWHLTAPLDPIVSGWLGLPAVAGLTLIFAVLRKELALQLLVVFAVAAYGSSAHDLSTFMTTTQLVVYGLVCALYIPCVATIAMLGRELGRRRAALITAGTVVTALVVGGVVNQVLVRV